MEEIQTKLIEAKQEHLMKFSNDLNENERGKFIKQLQTIDLMEMNEIFERSMKSFENNQTTTKMEPIPQEQFESEEKCNGKLLEEYRIRGLEAVSAGNVAVLLMAGGQGTRLGVSYPKGMYSVNLPSKKTLFQIQAERIRRIQVLAEEYTGKSDGIVPWYIMTSGPTDETTKQFLSTNNYFGLKPENVIQFKQGLLPCFDFDGKIILDTKSNIALAPDGNGGIYRALKINGILDDMKKRGIKYVHVHSVDNILTKVADPVFIGYCIRKQADCGAKVVRKSGPKEAVGIICKVNGSFQVVEYSELPDNLANLTDTKGNLIYNAGNICNHFFTTNFLNEIINKYETKLKLHIAKKKIPFINENGELIRPNQPNGIKIEKFVFDVFEFSQNFVTWEVPRHTEFSALKNSNDAKKDCPLTAFNDLIKLHRSYIEKAGGTVRDGCNIEISPLLSYAGENLKDKVYGKIFESDCVLPADCENA